MKKRKRRLPVVRGLLVALMAFLFCLTAVNAQVQSILRGVITDKDGKPLQAATIFVKGKQVTAATAADGSFTIEAAEGATLIISYVGFETQEVVVGKQSVLNISMKDRKDVMDDVIVIGYTTQQKKSVTGAVSTIKAADLMRTPAVAATSALVGKVPGITARATDARPGNGTQLQIRNLGAPLYVIDGVPYSTNDGTTNFGYNTGISGQNLFNNLGLDDIESISVLKDASASIYGLRASNGVVLVTTKKGKKGENATINVSGYYGLQNFTRYPKPANAGQYVRGRLESEQNLRNNPAALFTPEQLAKWEAGTEKGYKSYDYYDMVTRPNVPQYYVSANASGGTQKSSYYFAISHISQDALIKDFTFDRTNIQANLSAGLAKGLTIGTQIMGRVEKRHNVGVPGLDDYFNPLLSISSMWPTESPYANDNPRYINQTHNVNVNPATYTDEITGYIDEWFRSMNINLTAQYDFNFGLQIKGLYSYNFTNEDFDGFEYTYDAYIYNPTTNTYENKAANGALYGNQNPWREKHKRNIWSTFAQLQASYSKTFAQHSLSGVLAYERSDNENSYNALHSVPPNNYIPLMAFANQDFLDDAWSTEARAGYIGRINYNYQQKYLLELLGRYDGSYLYAADKRWGFFPGVSVGWRITQEDFFSQNLRNVVSDLKIRASYGETGSEIGLNAFDYLPGYIFAGAPPNDGRNAVLDNNYVIGIRPRGVPITNLSWVVNRTKNIGLDISLFRGKLTGQFDVFERKRTGLPAGRYDVLLPSEAGYSLPNENLVSDATRGIEGQIGYNGSYRKVNYSISVNATLARRRDLATYKPRFGNSWNVYRNSIEDRWGNINWGYQIEGRFQTQEEIDNYMVDIDGQGNRSLLPGDFKYKDVNGDKVLNAMDQRPIGYAEGQLPYMSFGINGSVQWKSFTLAFDFAGATMQSFYRDVELKYPFQNNGNSPAYMFEDHWHRVDPYDPNSAWVAGTYPAFRKDLTNHANFLIDGSRRNDFWLTNVHYIRLKNLELGYNFPTTLVKKMGLSRFRVYVNGTNLFSFDNVKQFEIDPEISSSGGLIYPQQKLFNFGFNLTF
jgi:TonB-linked SusC/RagA family outer membrane protein